MTIFNGFVKSGMIVVYSSVSDLSFLISGHVHKGPTISILYIDLFKDILEDQ